jgi:NAD(P)-dependent dehydrogenase (short-subunit alcohol dehydrogenase family)
MGRVAGKVAVVTGGGGGIGSQTAQLLAAEGARVVVADIAPEAAGRCVESIRESGGEAVFHPLDVREPGSFTELVRVTIKKFGRLDIMHNNAAATHFYEGDGGVKDMDPAHWDLVMQINVRGVMLGCKAVLPQMIAQGVGSIVNMSSTRAAAGALDLTAYGTSKSAVLGLTRYVATGYGRAGVRCNAILPGLILTPQAEALHADGMQKLLGHVLLPYAGTPDDIGHLVVFLGSDESRYITGQSLKVDGGMLTHQPFYADSLAAREGAMP